MPGFITVGPLPWHQELGLHFLDSVDYAANASVVPAIAAIGDKDVFFQSHVHMGEVLAREGLTMVNLISPGTGHVIDPVTHREQMRRIGEVSMKGLDHFPKQIRFVTWSLRYNRCHWIELLGLNQHYERAEIAASWADDGLIEISEIRNINRFAVLRQNQGRPGMRIKIAGSEVRVPKRTSGGGSDRIVLELMSGKWQLVEAGASDVAKGKVPGLQGPIDDAFVEPFVCVRGAAIGFGSLAGVLTILHLHSS